MKFIKPILLSIICVFSIWIIHAQNTILPLNSFGVWDRSNAIDISIEKDFSYLKGISADVNWEDVQKIDSSTYNWSEILSILQKAAANNQMVNISVGVGPDAPNWLYNIGVAKVLTNDTQHTSWQYYD